MHPFLIWLESTDFSTWVRESPSLFAFPAILSCHTIGMGLVAGTNAAIALRILGVALGRRVCGHLHPALTVGAWRAPRARRPQPLIPDPQSL
jgi:hypothetical protein